MDRLDSPNRERSKQRVIVGGSDAGGAGRSDANDVRGEEVDAVEVEVAAGAVLVLGGAGVDVPGQKFRTER